LSFYQYKRAIQFVARRGNLRWIPNFRRQNKKPKYLNPTRLKRIRSAKPQIADTITPPYILKLLPARAVQSNVSWKFPRTDDDFRIFWMEREKKNATRAYIELKNVSFGSARPDRKINVHAHPYILRQPSTIFSTEHGNDSLFIDDSTSRKHRIRSRFY